MTVFTWFLYPVEWVLVRSANLKTALAQVKVFTSLTVKSWSTDRVHEAFFAAVNMRRRKQIVSPFCPKKIVEILF